MIWTRTLPQRPRMMESLVMNKNAASCCVRSTFVFLTVMILKKKRKNLGSRGARLTMKMTKTKTTMMMILILMAVMFLPKKSMRYLIPLISMKTTKIMETLQQKSSFQMKVMFKGYTTILSEG
eukprot:PhF_6_TR3360/c0_g3_i1/m.4780